MKSLRSVNYSRLLNCCQTNQKLYLNLLGLLHYLASKIEKNNRNKEASWSHTVKLDRFPRIAERGSHLNSGGTRFMGNLHCQAEINVKPGSGGIWTSQKHYFPCRNMFGCVRVCVRMCCK